MKNLTYCVPHFFRFNSSYNGLIPRWVFRVPSILAIIPERSILRFIDNGSGFLGPRRSRRLFNDLTIKINIKKYPNSLHKGLTLHTSGLDIKPALLSQANLFLKLWLVRFYLRPVSPKALPYYLTKKRRIEAFLFVLVRESLTASFLVLGGDYERCAPFSCKYITTIFIHLSTPQNYLLNYTEKLGNVDSWKHLRKVDSVWEGLDTAWETLM